MAESLPDQRWEAEGYARNARFVAELARPLVDLLAPLAGERVLDLGCGDGALTAEIAARGARVIGFDRSPELLSAARQRGLDARQGDAAALPFRAEFDAVFSNAALHWMLDPDAVIAGVRRALVPGGRFVGEMGGFCNVAAIRVAVAAVLARRGRVAADLWYFATPDEYRRRLEAHGFTVSEIALVPRLTPLPTGMAGWLQTFAGPLLEVAGPGAAEEVIALLQPVLCDRAGNWTADYVRLRFKAYLKD